MGTTRQDSWNKDEDLLLAEVVLRHIREGSTQLSAFEEVGHKLSRTSAACGFRWNSYVRKQYKSAIQLAKQQRKEKPTTASSETEEQKAEPQVKSDDDQILNDKGEVTFNDVLTKLHQLNKAHDENDRLRQINKEFNETIDRLENEINKLQDEKNDYKERYELIEEDYKSLIEIMERARKMVVLRESDSEGQMHFQMDKNGNLERVKKS